MTFSSPSGVLSGKETLINVADYAELGNQILLGGNNSPRQVGITARFA
jgi:hypothetical protein